MVTNRPFEAVVIGSGATGGIAAFTLAKMGIRVLVIEAGPYLSSKKALGSEPMNTFNRFKEIINGNKRIQAQHPGYWKNNPALYINENENKYTYPKDSPFLWTQGRQVGGRSLTWGGITLRLAKSDFKQAQEDNYYPEWPIKYDDLEQHYKCIEESFDIYGEKDDLDQLPNGCYKESLPFTRSEVSFGNKIKRELDFPIIHSRGFSTHDPQDDGEWPKFSSLGSSLSKALKTGKVEILSNHLVDSIIMNNDQTLAKGLVVIDCIKGIRKTIDSKLIILCASTIQSIKIILNSSERHKENGLIEPSGKLGSYLMDHISTCRFFALPVDKEEKKHALSGAGSFFIPFGKELDKNTKIDFIRGYGIWGGIGRFEPPNIIKKNQRTSTGFLIGHGEVLAYEDNKVILTKDLDKWGIPIPKITFKWKDNELKMVKHMNKTIEKCIKASGGEMLNIDELLKVPCINKISQNAFALKDSPPPPGYYVHEVGGAPMGTTKDNSVLDKWNRLWECKNVLIVDGACWPTSSWQSPTLTMMAITRRACINVIKNYS